MDRKYYRKHTRLPGYDYASPGYYFVTICTKNRQKLFVPTIDKKYGHELPFDIAAGASPAQLHDTGIVVNKIELLIKKVWCPG